ncbi:MAG TPA: DUF222 domain-containing protein [Trebonia sp.]|nr:DUF222 domain-containing protein [Trebonia sp.]
MADDEVFGVLGRWGAAECWVAARKLAVARELIRRRPSEENPGEATHSGLPWEWDDRLAYEVALHLRMSIPAARKLLQAAWALEARLPRIGQALDEGRVDLGRARMLVQETDVLSAPEELRRAEELILAGLDRCQTWTDLLRLAQRAVVTVDPAGAAKRRQKEERENARVSFWREAAGTCALLGSGLPTDEALQAHAHVDRRAQQYRAAGIKRPIGILRVAAYLDLLNLAPAADRIARFQAEDATAGAAQAGDRAGRAGTPRDARDPEHPAATRNPEPAAPTTPSADASAGAQASASTEANAGAQAAAGAQANAGAQASGGTEANAGAGTEASTGTEAGARAEAGAGSGRGTDGSGPPVAAEVNLVLRHLDIPFLTAAGHAQRAGEARSLGVLDPVLARRIAEAAARHPDSKFCLTIVDENGCAIGHGCCRPRRARGARSSRERREGQFDGPPPPPAQGFALARADGTGPPGGFGSWLLTLPGQGRDYVVDLHPVPTGECGHQYESAGHDPGDRLRHLVNVRDGKCGFPACSRHARETDFEHARPYDQGGRTCGCNCWSCSRSCHRVKQSRGWKVEEVKPGHHQWTTPSGRTYTQGPWRYPV